MYVAKCMHEMFKDGTSKAIKSMKILVLDYMVHAIIFEWLFNEHLKIVRSI